MRLVKQASTDVSMQIYSRLEKWVGDIYSWEELLGWFNTLWLKYLMIMRLSYGYTCIQLWMKGLIRRLTKNTFLSTKRWYEIQKEVFTLTHYMCTFLHRCSLNIYVLLQVHIFNLLHEEMFEKFSVVLEDYLEKSFSSPLAHK